MSTFREIIYMCSDQLKLSSDDTFFTNDHILYLLKKYRGLFLSQKYKDVRKEIPESNYQTICLDLIQVPAISGEPCEGGTFLRTKNKIPTTPAKPLNNIITCLNALPSVAFKPPTSAT